MRPYASRARAALLALASCAASVLSTSCAISQQQEVDLGASTAAQVDTELPLVRDGAVVKYINTLGNQLAKVTDTRNLAWTFTVVDTKEVNAFALPGGWVYVNRGLIERATDMSELAGVLAHEIGHVTLRHSVQQMQQAEGANVGVGLLCTLTKVCDNQAGAAAINVGGSALFAKFSRTDEAEADAEAVSTTVKAGISPEWHSGDVPDPVERAPVESQRGGCVLCEPPVGGGSHHGDRGPDRQVPRKPAPTLDEGYPGVPDFSAPAARTASVAAAKDTLRGGVSVSLSPVP